MSDNLRRYRAIRDACRPYDPSQPPGTLARHVITLAALIRGMMASPSPQWPNMASQVPNGTTPASRGKRLTRWRGNPPVTEAVDCVPYAALVLQQVALQPLVWVRDGRGVGRGGVARMLHVV